MREIKSLSECLKDGGIISLHESIINSMDTITEDYTQDEETLNEGLKEIFQAIKNKFAKVVEFFKGLAAKISKSLPIWLKVDNDGNTLPVSLPLTAAQAYKDGFIKKVSTCVIPSKEVGKIVGLKTSLKDAEKLYGSGNSLKYWDELYKIGESLEIQETPLYENAWNEMFAKTVNEVKLSSDSGNKYNTGGNAEFQDNLKYWLSDNMKEGAGLVWGAPGIGKTAILTNVVKSLPNGNEWTVVVKSLAHETADNFVLPKYTEDRQGSTRAEDAPKTWLPVYHPTGDAQKDKEADEDLGKGLLFIDELSRAKEDVLNVCLQIALDHKFDDWKMGSGWKIICASNRPEDEKRGQSLLGNAMINRLDQFYFEPTLEDWEGWARKQGFISPLLLQWLESPDDKFGGRKYFYYDPDETSEDDVEKRILATPRSWTLAMEKLSEFANTANLEGFKLLDVFNSPGGRNRIGRALGGFIPENAIDSFLGFLSIIAKVGDIDRIVEEVWKSGKLNIDKNALRNVTLPVAQLIITSHASSLPTEKEFENLGKVILDSGSDQMASFIMDIFKNVFFGEWVDSKKWDSAFYIKLDVEEYEKTLNGCPSDFRKLSDAGQRNNYIDNLRNNGASESEIDKFHNYASAIAIIEDINAVYKKLFDHWGISDATEFPDYSKTIMKIGKKYESLGPLLFDQVERKY